MTHMSDKKNYGFTTTILHNDRRKPIEHGSLHKPIHTSVAFGYNDARQLASVFQGKEPGFRYGRQGNPTVAALEDKITQDGRRRGHPVLRHRHGGDRRAVRRRC
jgi:O-acetylhomoserine (thiol)-lyase